MALPRLTDGLYAGTSTFLNSTASEIDNLSTSCAVRRLSHAASAAANTDYVIVWESLDLDTYGGQWSTQAPSYIRCQIAGTYDIDCSLLFGYTSATAYASGSRMGRIFVNDTTPANAVAVDKKPFSVDGEGVILSMVANVRLNVGDRVYAGFRHSASAAIDCLWQELGGTTLTVSRTGP